MKKKNICIIAAVLLVALAVVLYFVLRDDGEAATTFDPSMTVVEDSARGLKLISLDTIAGAYVEDGSDAVSENIFTALFQNAGGSTLQLANAVITINGTEYRFDITTLPPGAQVRVMEKDKKQMPETFESCTMSAENIIWFESEPSLCEDRFEIIERSGGLVVTNISDETVSAPIYLFYKNYDGEIYIGGITYMTTVEKSLAPGESVAVVAGHFIPGSSKLMYVYVP